MNAYDAWALATAAFVIGLAAMAALQVVMHRAPGAARMWLLLLICASALSSLGDLTLHLHADSLRRWLEPFATSALTLLGPAVWLYVQGLTQPESTARGALRRSWAHVLPAVLVLMLLLAGAATGPVEPGAERRSLGDVFALLPIAAQLAIYGIALARHLRRLQARVEQQYSNLSRRTLRWVWGVMLLYALVLAAWIVTWTWPIALSDLLTNALMAVVVAWLALFGLEQGEIPLAAGDPESEPPEVQPRYRKARLGEEQVEDLRQRLHILMQDDKPHLESDLTLGQLATRAGVTAHQLSQYLSLHENRSFYEYINDWRVAAVKATLARPQAARRPLLEIALECGFGSKSTFNAVFKRATGMSPTEYRDGLPGTAARDG